MKPASVQFQSSKVVSMEVIKSKNEGQYHFYDLGQPVFLATTISKYKTLKKKAGNIILTLILPLHFSIGNLLHDGKPT